MAKRAKKKSDAGDVVTDAAGVIAGAAKILDAVAGEPTAAVDPENPELAELAADADDDTKAAIAEVEALEGEQAEATVVLADSLHEMKDTEIAEKEKVLKEVKAEDAPAPYIVIANDTLYFLNLNVEDAISEGYKPLGGIATSVVQMQNPNGVMVLTEKFYQAMILR